jgi:hypothetical protein
MAQKNEQNRRIEVGGMDESLLKTIYRLREETKFLELEFLGVFPSELITTKVTVGSSLLVDGLEEVKFLDNDTRTEIKVISDDLDKFSLSLIGGTVGINENGKRLSNTNSIRKLDKSTTSELGVDQRLGDPTSSVGSGTIDLGPILTRESTTTVSTETTICRKKKRTKINTRKDKKKIFSLSSCTPHILSSPHFFFFFIPKPFLFMIFTHRYRR